MQSKPLIVHLLSFKDCSVRESFPCHWKKILQAGAVTLPLYKRRGFFIPHGDSKIQFQLSIWNAQCKITMTSLNLIYSNMACGSDEQAGGLGWPRQSCSLCSPASPLLSAPSPFQVPREARGVEGWGRRRVCLTLALDRSGSSRCDAGSFLGCFHQLFRGSFLGPSDPTGACRS